MYRFILIDKYKVICIKNEKMILCSGNKLYKRNVKGESAYIGSIPIEKKYKIAILNKYTRRMLRIEPRCGLFISDDEALVSMHGAVYLVNVKTDLIIKEHSFRTKMNNPLSFCEVTDLKGFDDGIYYGEYFGNKDREAVCIYFRNTSGLWNKVYEFERNSIQHIHRVFIHKERESIFVLTGDKDDECAIWEFKDHFKIVKKIVGGKQIYRSCVAFPHENGIVYATDSPLVQNSIFHIDLSDGKVVMKKIRNIDGPCIFGWISNIGEMYFSTSVEPDSNISCRLHYMLSYKLGNGVKNRYSHIYKGRPDDGIKEIFAAKKDLFPMLLFEFGNFLFPSNNTDSIFVTGQSITKLDGKTIKLLK